MIGDATTRVFVYGTLKRGGSNHSFLAGQEYLGEARTGPGYTLYSLGEFPGMVRDPADRAGVTGELWAINRGCLARLDELEGVAEGLYERVTILLAAPAGAAAEGYLYLGETEGRTRLGAAWPA